MEGNIKIVIGSWGSYNECNERALGSKWLDLSDYSDWDEIREELKKEGFELDGIDETIYTRRRRYRRSLGKLGLRQPRNIIQYVERVRRFG